MITKYIFIFGLVLTISCTNNNHTPSGILKSEKMQAILWDVIKADAFTTEYIKKDTTKNDVEENLKLQTQIFAIHKVSKAVFYNSYAYYKSNMPLFIKMLDSMVTHAERNKNFKISPSQAL